MLVALAWLVLTQASVTAQEPSSQFHSFARSIIKFHDAYGYYPKIFDESGVFRFKQADNSERFIEAMAGQTWAGKIVALHGNVDSKRFYEFRDSDFSKEIKKQIIDQFGNNDIVIVVDFDGDGSVTIPDNLVPAPIVGRVHSYSRFDDGTLCVSTWGALSKEAVVKFKEDSAKERRSVMISYTVITIFLFSAWWYVRDKIMD